MKVSELIEILQEECNKYGDMNLEICRYTDTEVKYYWMSCAFVKKGVFVVGYNIDSLRRMEH